MTLNDLICVDADEDYMLITFKYTEIYGKFDFHIYKIPSLHD